MHWSRVSSTGLRVTVQSDEMERLVNPIDFTNIPTLLLLCHSASLITVDIAMIIVEAKQNSTRILRVFNLLPPVND